jgi:hypothetical protein
VTDQSDPNFLDDLARSVRAVSDRLDDLELQGQLAQLGLSTPARSGFDLSAMSLVQGAGEIVPAAVIADNAVTADSIVASAITTAKLAAGAVTADSIAAGAITTAKLDAAAVTTAKLDASAVIALVTNAGATVIIDAAGIAVTNGAITVTNPGSTVIIDGTSNMFKIMASGSMASSFPAAGGAHTVSATVSGSGSSVLQTLFMTGYDNSSTANLRGLDGVEAVISGSGTISFRAYTYVNISGGDNKLNLVAESSISNPGTTAMARYYLLKEVGI